MSALLQDCIVAADIERVIWIDDRFAEPNIAAKLIALPSLIIELKIKAPDTSLSHPFFSEHPLSESEDVLRQAANEYGENSSEDGVHLYALVTDELGKLSNAEDPNDLRPGQFKALKASFGERLKTRSYGEWEIEKNQYLADSNSRTCYLIDKEFNIEGPHLNGNDILKEILDLDLAAAFCVMLTQTTSPEKEDVLRKEIADQLGKKSYQFAVLSKQRAEMDEAELEKSFAQAFQKVFTHAVCDRLSNRLITNLQSILISTHDALVAHSTHELDQVIFGRSHEEGSSELDLLLRLMLLNLRYEAQLKFTESEYLTDLSRLRDLRQLSKLPVASITSESKFGVWRQRELFDEANLINVLHSPLAGGDLFITDTKKEYVLLCQACDIALRGKDDRKSKTGLFVEKKRQVPDDKASMERYYIFKDAEAENQHWYFDFLHSFPVDLELLDLSVLNDQGKVEFCLTQNSPSGLNSRLQKRFQCFKQSLSKSDKDVVEYTKRRLSLHGSFGKGKWNASTKLWMFPLARIGRIRSPYSDAILGAYAAFQARAAFDHDFTRLPKND